ncbi:MULTISPECIES: FecR family protein [unclassified Chelatococcus]|uniref:FecR domain-containing protein n=1 Tax=unclassified Chelatococcus TaxID=2638111 RepID=UPI001BCE3FC3|nr:MULTISPECIES: FecR family protein [unclassified Chelatococcus]MBS7698664.1 FecR domain-containing protein [Chelatococcus sp. YT9]MBX3554754.1 FecR domain-containing protein [Chelatococcus sp.]
MIILRYGPLRQAASITRATGLLGASLAACIGIASPGPVHAQSAGCATSAGSAGQTVLRCRSVTIEVASGASAGLVDDNGDDEPDAVEVSAGAIYIVYQRSGQRRFQVQTPHAVASVRGTTWAVDVTPAQSAVFVQEGRVGVTRARGGRGVVLTAGEGVDVAPGRAPLVVNRWGAARVAALLARFGR